MYLDKVKIYCKAGNGGNGAVSFHREKYVPNGGPDGGDGGRGGSIYFMADESINNLISFRYTQHYRAENGANGEKKNQFGKSGKDIIIKVPRGTIIKDEESGKIIADVFNYGEKILVLKGGLGGKGNAKFANSLRKTPRFSEDGEKTIERAISLELKTISDVGLVGYPNVGKSTLLSVISSAKPEIANYHFTTITPNLGVVEHDYKTFVVADIPGLIEGAAIGVGLGHNFLRHVERVRLIVHIVDISGYEGRDPVRDYLTIREELRKYSEKLAELPEIIVANKTDLTQDDKNLKRLEKETKAKILKISAIARKGTKELVRLIADKLIELPEPKQMEVEPFEYEKDDINEFEVYKDGNVFYVEGGFIEHIARRVNLEDIDSFRYFQKTLKLKGVFKELRKKGAKDGDTVNVLGIEFDYID